MTELSVPAPFLISWNITKRCNLKCAHCYLDASELAGSGEVSTVEAKRFIDEIAALNPSAMLILTGGEPLLRPDLYELSADASSRGLTVVLGTNGTLIDGDTVRKLKEHGVKGAGVSLDGLSPSYHDKFRGVDGAWQRTITGMDSLREGGLDFQVQVTVTRENKDLLPSLIELARQKEARAINFYFLVCTGRGQNMTDLTPLEYESVLEYLARAEDALGGELLVRARCAPHFLRIAARINPGSSLLKGATSGCIAGRGYLRISPDGFVTPCPYIPVAASSPSLRDTALKEIWENGPQFVALRNPVLKGNCKGCEFEDVCGGCRARALASSGDLMGEDPWCSHKPDGRKETPAPSSDPVWTKEAEERLSSAPSFLRGMIRRGAEKYAKSKGLCEITPELMAELRRRSGR